MTPKEEGVKISFQLVEGKKETELSIPLSREEIEQLYKVPGFLSYVKWEELFEADFIDNELIPYDLYYELLQDDDGSDLLSSLGLPIEEMKMNGELKLNSLPDEGDLSLHLKTETGQNFNRVANGAGALFEMDGELNLLPQRVYKVKKALNEDFENGYQKIAICQKLAEEANLNMEDFLQKESFHVLDTYGLDVKVHHPAHIELVASGESEKETIALNAPSSITSFKEGMERERFARTTKVSNDLSKISEKRHITGEEVPLFFENPLAVLPEHDYQFDVEQFSERVRGLIPIEKVRPTYKEGSGYSWFDEETGKSYPYDEEFLKDLMLQHPDQQYVQHEGKWIYLDPTLRKALLEVEEDEENKIKQQYALDIKDNEQELDYELKSENRLQLIEAELPETLQADLFPHQEEGYRWICTLEAQKRGGLLADDMGLGKTIQVITYLLKKHKLQQLTPTLIVLPIALIENWVEEIRKFAPSLTKEIYIHKGSGRLKSAEHISSYGLVFTSYDTLKIDQLVLGKVKFKAIICDEAQNVKSHSSQRSRALRAMQADFRLAMTGTPVENSLDELWSIMDFVQPGYLESLKDFRMQFVESGNYDGLLEKLQAFYLRRTKEEVLKGKLPDKYIKEPELVEASSIQKDIARSMIMTKEMGQVAILNMLMRLRQLYGHPGAAVPQYEEAPTDQVPKLQKVLEILDDVKSKNEKVIIFTEFRKIHSILKRTFMQRYGISVPIIDGDTKNRQNVVKLFNESSGFGVMLLSPKAAGVGLTITSANHVIHYTRWWNPAVENQATDRAYRIGQQKDVYVYHIITQDSENFPQGTVEQLMHQLLEDKRELAENVIVPFNENELKKLVVEQMKGNMTK
ncbi:DEAD/DEAH box helicase [Alkalihalobacterium alkalinitrilicum]|uniref:DEAD/DEAH box helicase n=1 Tax=Alkalihalobacterium alkalinitrilicum TaxID=427920 RepID=UPI001EE4784E|nr:DEAD/DEAH box helicase [Alkalihalobacterium alkalinitrilicum]